MPSGVLEKSSWGCDRLALSKVVGPERFGMVPHYRSGCLCSMCVSSMTKMTFP